MASQDYKFEGWLGNDPSSADGKMVWGEFEPKPWEETDVDIKISHCGICGSDLHTLRSGWGPTMYPCCVGHEIVGTAVRVGKEVQHIKLGDRVGVGAQSDSCKNKNNDCPECAAGNEQYCSHGGMIGTYNGKYSNGGKSYGGYATYNRTPAHFVIKIPDEIPNALAAPMLCAGATTYVPLKRHGCGPGKRVGIIGLGGLGHFGLLWAKALGAEYTVVIGRSDSKREDAMKLGADKYVATNDEKNWVQENARSVDFLVSSVSSSKMPLREYLSLLRVGGTLIQVGIPEDGPLSVPADALVWSGVNIGGSLIGSPSEIREMFELAAEKQVKPWIEERPMKDANKAIVEMEEGKARYRYVLVNEQ
ncbi:putative zinc-binding alcohol dehydrogenase [Sporormia fimetaria CBS 119925]|uniref:alcohol dehydrogenase (NADP(+)) n=1 Tax=Sporormia fimetaria CBS 119925 TaxID=1340428 RepID=A0A6A6V4P9_9PLEO|nr:putative zinc-binding alcohol dehydrogenase [Sporormia fimetaria CBS 119925]